MTLDRAVTGTGPIFTLLCVKAKVKLKVRLKVKVRVKIKGKVHCRYATKAQRGRRCILILFL
jgi:hypothetical protein